MSAVYRCGSTSDCSCLGPSCSCIADKLDPAHAAPSNLCRRTPRLWSIYESSWYFRSPFPGSATPPWRCYGVETYVGPGAELCAPRNGIAQVHSSGPCSCECFMLGGDDPDCTLWPDTSAPMSSGGWESKFNVDEGVGVCSSCGTPHPIPGGDKCGKLRAPCFACGACVVCFAAAVHGEQLSYETVGYDSHCEPTS